MNVPDPATLFCVAGKKAIVTGGRRGLGLAMAAGLARAGADVAIVSTKPCSVDTLQDLQAHGTRIVSIQADLRNPDARRELVTQAAQQLGGLDVLVNNAGAQHRAPVLDYPIENFRDDQELMVTSLFDLSVQAGRIMARQGSGAIVNVSSISGLQGARKISGYIAAKHAVIGLTKSLAMELGPMGITVNCIAPGIFETDMHEGLTPERKQTLRDRIPRGRLGDPGDVVGPLLFLVSEAGAYVHGSTVVVDGGWCAH